MRFGCGPVVHRPAAVGEPERRAADRKDVVVIERRAGGDRDPALVEVVARASRSPPSER